jgi:sugar (pentulose or hexulose) kinase
MAVLSQNALLDPRLMNLHHESDRWVANGVVETGGGALRWFRDQCCYADVLNAEKTGQGAFEIIIDDAAEVSPGSDGVSFFPYLLGERLMGSPYSRGVFFC